MRQGSDRHWFRGSCRQKQPTMHGHRLCWGSGRARGKIGAAVSTARAGRTCRATTAVHGQDTRVCANTRDPFHIAKACLQAGPPYSMHACVPSDGCQECADCAHIAIAIAGLPRAPHGLSHLLATPKQPFCLSRFGRFLGPPLAQGTGNTEAICVRLWVAVGSPMLLIKQFV